MYYSKHSTFQQDLFSTNNYTTAYVEDRTLANDPYSTAATAATAAAAAHKEQQHLRWIVTLQQSPHHHIIYIYRPLSFAPLPLLYCADHCC
jgi:hypothetical protein